MVGLFSCSEGNPSQPQSAVADADDAALMRLCFFALFSWIFCNFKVALG